MMQRSSQFSFESNRELLYKPEQSAISKLQMTKQALSSSAKATGLSDRSIAQIASGWKQATSSIDHRDPSDCALSRDTVVSSMRDLVDQSVKSDRSIINPKTGIATCKNSSIRLPDGTVKSLNEDHKVVYSSSDNNPTVIVDALPAAALDGIVDKSDMDHTFPSGHSNFTDGLTVSSLYEYAGYSTLDIDYMHDTETGEILWDNDTGLGKDNSETSAQREMLDKSPKIIFPPINRRRSPTDDDLKAEKEPKQFDDDLEQLFYEDMGR